jgi:hypothetical protein
MYQTPTQTGALDSVVMTAAGARGVRAMKTPFSLVVFFEAFGLEVEMVAARP